MDSEWLPTAIWEFNPRLFGMFLDYFLEQVAGRKARHLYRVRRITEGKADYQFFGFDHRKAT